MSNVNDTLNVRGTTLTKAFSPASIPQNGTSTLTFTLANGIGNPTQNGLAFTETLPASMTVKTTAATPQCNGTVTATAGGNTITLAGGNMSLGQANCTVDVDVTAAAAATYTNLPANLSGLSTGMTNGIPVGGVTLTVNPPPTLAKSFLPVEVGVGQTSVLTLTINNSAGNPAQAGLGFTDTLPANLVLADGVTTNTCNGTVSDLSNNPLAANATGIKLAAGSIASGTANCSITVNVKSVVPATYTNSQAGGNISAAAGGLSITGATATLNVRGTTLTKAFSPGVTALNDPITLTFTITNSGGNPAQAGLSFTDTLGGMTLSAVPASPQCGGTVTGSIGGNVAGFSGGALGSGVGSCTVVFSGVASAVGSYVNNAANMSNISPGMTNSVNATLTVNNLPTLTKAFSSATAGIGQTSTLVFTITNPATAPLRTGLAFTDTLPAGLTIANPPAPSSTCSPLPTFTAVNGTQPFTASGFGIPAGPSTCTVTVSVTGTSLGAKNNGAADITAITGMNNDVTTQTMTVVQPGVTKTFGAASILESLATSLVFTLTNGAGNPAQGGISLGDTLPSGLRLNSATPAVTYSAGCSGPATAAYASGTRVLSGLTGIAMAASTASCTVTVAGLTNQVGQVGTCPNAAFTNLASNITTSRATNSAADQCLTVNALASLTFFKSATTAVAGFAAPGEDITYTLQTTNTSPSTATSVLLSDHLSPYAYWKIDSFGAGIPFLLTQGAIPSGLTLGTPVYSNNNGTTYLYTPLSGAGGAPAGYDGNVTDWQIPMTGTMNGSNASFSLQYKVRVK